MSRRTLAILSAVAVIVGLVAGLVAVGAGDDDDNGTSLPEISVPAGEPQTVPQETDTTEPKPDGTGGANGTGGAKPGGGGGGSVNPSEPDTATNDKPPPAGSPEEAFEQFCEQNPGACG